MDPRHFSKMMQAAKNARYDRQLPTLQDIRSQAVLDLDGAQENANGWEAAFFAEANTVVSPVEKTQDPSISSKSNLDGDKVIGVSGLTLEVEKEGKTLTEQQEILDKLSRCELEFKLGTDLICNIHAGSIMQWSAGGSVSNDGNANYSSAAQAPLAVAGQVQPMKRNCFQFPDILFLNSNNRPSARLIGKCVWTQTADLNVYLHLHGAVARA